MQSALRKFVHDLMAEMLGLDGDKVVWANQTFPRVARPFATLRISSQKDKALAERRASGTEGVFNYLVPIEAKLELQVFCNTGEHPDDWIEQVILDLHKPSVVDRCQVEGIAFWGSEPVADITGLLRDKQTFEPRAAVDLSIRYWGIAQDEGYIDEVVIEGMVDGKKMDIDIS